MTLDNRHQDKSGQVERKKNTTRVDTLRKVARSMVSGSLQDSAETCISAL